ncbi:winged helix DNA-binding protein [Microbaculum sp. FT89]|uniref:winged helix DNA-binding protein n=1 Tax=Microbaculum sp. FT89 TaxID=3447298 RepID=UPI003F539408
MAGRGKSRTVKQAAAREPAPKSPPKSPTKSGPKSGQEAEQTSTWEPGPIVSSAHLAAGGMASLSEFEFGLILASHAFHRWMVRCIEAAGISGLSALDVMVLHSVAHRARSKKLADICLVLNVEDTHLVTYAVRKLEAQGLVKSGRAGKEKTVEITAKGEGAVQRYHEVREALLVRAVKGVGFAPDLLSDNAALLRVLSGHYDQAARSAASL